VSEQKPLPDPAATAEMLASAFFGVESDLASVQRAVRRWLVAAAWAVVVTPLHFWLRFGEVGPLGWGLTVFFVVYCLLTAVGLYFLRRPAYHSPLALRGDWLDRIGAFWLVACAFGPLFGWVLVSAFPLSEATWRWLYAARALLSVGLPVFTALALLRYVRGKGTWVMLALLIGVTALPVWSAWDTCRDLTGGPVQTTTRAGPILPYTGQELRK